MLNNSQKLRRSLLHSILLGLLIFLFITTIPVQAGINLKLAKTPTQIEQGRTLYFSGQFTQAAEIWQQAAADFARQHDSINHAWSLSLLSLAAQNLGKWDLAQTAIASSLEELQQLEKKHQGDVTILAQALNTQGSLKLAIGQAEAALNSWQQSEQAYAATGDTIGVLGAQINQAQALQTLGLYRRSQKLLVAANQRLQSLPDSRLKVEGMRGLGVALQVVGDLQQSQAVLEQSLAIQSRLGDPTLKSEILFSLGNTARNLQQTATALNYYQQAVESATNLKVKIEAQLNQLSLQVESQPEQTQSLRAQITAELEQLPASRMSVYAAVNFARSLTLKDTKLPTTESKVQIAEILARAVHDARSIGDSRAEAYALTQLGELYEQTKQFADALTLSQQSLSIAQGINAPDIAYRAAWQLGRILKHQGDTEGAIAAYNSSVKTLKSLRSDLVAINRDFQFSFQESVEPVYRQLVEMLLATNENQNNLKQAREVIEALQIAELDNFFREACLDAKPQQIDQIDKTAAVIYPIILSDRLQVIVSLPGLPLSTYRTILPQPQIESILRQMRQSLNPAFDSTERLQLYQQMYDWLIRPIEPKLTHSGIKTLAFVLDGYLRNLPMAALHDGKQYLVEKYGIALSPGLQLLKARSLQENQIQVIAGGLSESRQGFKAIPAVKSEISQIQGEVSTHVLLNKNFTSSKLRELVNDKPFSVLHLATHGQFSSKSEDTFILAWDRRINVKELDELLRVRNQSVPVELVIFSACQTAKGDNRAILGLAGVAVRSGARSTLATLWAVQDDSTSKFMVEFYKQLSLPGVSKAEALRKAQLAFLSLSEYQHPLYWAPIVLVGNWLKRGSRGGGEWGYCNEIFQKLGKTVKSSQQSAQNIFRLGGLFHVYIRYPSLYRSCCRIDSWLFGLAFSNGTLQVDR